MASKPNVYAPILLNYSVESRFRQNFVRDDKSKCWLWYGRVAKNGYGIFKIKHRSHAAHRVMWAIVDDDPKELCVLHKCDVRDCVNPNHLFLGTREDNNKDRVMKGRSVHVCGEKAFHAKLNKEQVIEIKNLLEEEKFSQRIIGEKYGVKQTTIANIKAGNSWGRVLNG